MFMSIGILLCLPGGVSFTGALHFEQKGKFRRHTQHTYFLNLGAQLRLDSPMRTPDYRFSISPNDDAPLFSLSPIQLRYRRFRWVSKSPLLYILRFLHFHRR
jgi:hypothetical protein